MAKEFQFKRIQICFFNKKSPEKYFFSFVKAEVSGVNKSHTCYLKPVKLNAKETE